jgi:hypothetical protein
MPERSTTHKASRWHISIRVLVPAILISSTIFAAGGWQGVAMAASQPSLSAVPGGGQPGQSIRLTGKGFPGKRTVLIAWDGSTTGMPSPTTTASGSFETTVLIPGSARMGSNPVLAKAWLSATKEPIVAATSLEVTASSGAATATPLPTSTTVTATPTVTPLPPSPTLSPSPTATATAITTEPTAGQKCPDWLHDQYRATGPDGNSYPTWHPSTHSSGCWFGHEHGDDPRGAPALAGRPVLFGYAGAKAGLSEPHSGYKVFRWDNVNHPNAPSHTGSNLLMTLHQGTSGAGRFTTVHHSVQVDYINPSDGRELHLALMAPFGTLMVGCGANDPSPSLQLQQGSTIGMRQVSADKCFNSPNIPYEDWITALYVGTDESGGWTAYFDPHFAVFEPSTYCIANGGSCTLGYSDTRAGTGADPLGPNAGFKGTKREAYLNQVWVDNAGGATTVWTDPYGKTVQPGAVGAIPQYICALDAQPLVNSAAFGEDRNHDDGTVRAPN